MKKTRLNCLAAVALAVLALPEALAEAADCSPITQASQQGRAGAIQSINYVETGVMQQVNQQRSCLERLSDATRQTVTVGGFDLGPIRTALVQEACNSFGSVVNRAQSQVSGAVSQATSGIGGGAVGTEMGRMVTSNVNQAAGQVANQMRNGSSSQQSVWDRMANWLR